MVFCDWLLSLSIVSSRLLMLLYISALNFFSWLNIICIYHILFTHSSADGHLGCSGCYEQCYYEYPCTRFYGDICFHSLRNIPRSGIARSYGYSMFKVLRHSLPFFKVAVPFHILTSRVWSFQFLHIFSNTCYYLTFVFSHPTGC